MSSATMTGVPAVSARKCAYCAEEILADAKKCKHCGEFVNRPLSMTVGAIFAAGIMIACALAGMRTGSSDGVTTVGVWAIFVLLFAKTFGRI